jgi:predicted phosphoribosyltransferase
VGAHYREFHQVDDDEVIAALDAAHRPAAAG